jgi:hypothetical protein
MAKYLLISRCPDSLQIEIPTRYEKISFILAKSQGKDILPYVGSIEACRQIAQLHFYRSMGYIEIVEEA